MSCGQFEGHVVYRPDNAVAIREAAGKLGFHFSYIVGEMDVKPELANARLLYCTKRGNDYQNLKDDITALINSIDTAPIRYKTEVMIEDMVLDRKEN